MLPVEPPMRRRSSATPKQPGEPWPHDVDRLELGKRESKRAPPDQAGLDQHVVVDDPPARHEPRDEAEHHQQRDDTDLDVHLDRRAVRRETASAGARSRSRSSRDLRARPETGGAAAARACRSQPGRPRLSELGEPVTQPRRLLAREARDPSVACRSRRVHMDGGEPERALERPRTNVDVLHSPVRDDREPIDEDTATDEQVVLALGVTPGGEPPSEHALDNEARDQRRGCGSEPLPRSQRRARAEPRRQRPRSSCRRPPRSRRSVNSRRSRSAPGDVLSGRPTRVHAASMPARSDPYAERLAVERQRAAEVLDGEPGHERAEIARIDPRRPARRSDDRRERELAPDTVQVAELDAAVAQAAAMASASRPLCIASTSVSTSLRDRPSGSGCPPTTRARACRPRPGRARSGPPSIRAASPISSIRTTIWPAASSIISTNRDSRSPRSPARIRVFANPLIVASGVRRS